MSEPPPAPSSDVPLLPRPAWLALPPVFAACFVVHLESFGFAGIELLPLLLLLLAAATAAFGMWRRRGPAIAVGVALGTTIVTATFMASPVCEWQKNCSRRRGDAIAAALAHYRALHGSYPERLVDLVPELLPRVPFTAMGVWTTVRFVYTPTDDDYELRFAEPVFLSSRRTARQDWITLD